MFEKPYMDWSEIPESVPGTGHRQDHNTYRSLDEGRIEVAVPIRVLSGVALGSLLSLETHQGVFDIPYNRIELLALGLIIQQVGPGREPRSSMRMKIREILLGDPERKIKAKSHRENHLLDIYVRDMDAPLRIDQSSVSYRSFLNNPGYVSIANFRQVVEKITGYCKNTPLDHNLQIFLKNPKEHLPGYDSVYEFMMESRILRFRLQNPVPAEGDKPEDTENSEGKKPEGEHSEQQ